MPKLPVRFAQKGFTLIELLIVIVIIGILAGVVLVVLNPAKQQRKSAESVLASNTNKLCLALYACAQTTPTLANCDTFPEMGAASPAGVPTGSTYTVTTTDPVTITGGLIAGGGSKTANVACNYTCSYNFGSGVAVALAPSAGCY